MKSEFHEEDTENIMVIVCTTANFDYTEFAVVPISDALNCMGDDEINKRRRISIKRQKNGKNLRYYGTAISDITAKKLTDCDTYFGFDQN